MGHEGGELVALAGSTGVAAWRSSVGFAPTWAANLGDVVVVAGAGGAACRRRDDGGPLWDFPAPPGEHCPHSTPNTFRPILDPVPPEPLEGFQVSAWKLYFMQGRRRLFSLDVNTGQLLWARWAPSAKLHLPPPRGTFCPTYHVRHQTVQTVLLQTASGRRWLLDAASGRLIHDAAGSAQPWSSAPVDLGEDRLCLVEDGHRVVCLDAATGQEVWSYALSDKSTLTGLSTQVLTDGKSLLIVTPTNLGCRVERLDPSTGKSLWLMPTLPAPARFDTAGWALDREAFYRVCPQPSPSDAWPSGLLLECRSLDDGRLRWQRPVKGAPVWTVRRVGEGLLCLPCPRPVAQFRFRWAFGALQWVGDLPPNDPSASVLRGEYPMLWCDPQTGTTVQRLNFESVPRLSWSRPGWCSLNLGLSLAPGSFEEGCPPLRLGRQTAVVALGGDVWGLAAD
jgi:outer membrane protein assembly factor BamB